MLAMVIISIHIVTLSVLVKVPTGVCKITSRTLYTLSLSLMARARARARVRVRVGCEWYIVITDVEQLVLTHL